MSARFVILLSVIDSASESSWGIFLYPARRLRHGNRNRPGDTLFADWQKWIRWIKRNCLNCQQKHHSESIHWPPWLHQCQRFLSETHSLCINIQLSGYCVHFSPNLRIMPSSFGQWFLLLSVPHVWWWFLVNSRLMTTVSGHASFAPLLSRKHARRKKIVPCSNVSGCAFFMQNELIQIVWAAAVEKNVTFHTEFFLVVF